MLNRRLFGQSIALLVGAVALPVKAIASLMPAEIALSGIKEFKVTTTFYDLSPILELEQLQVYDEVWGMDQTLEQLPSVDISIVLENSSYRFNGDNITWKEGDEFPHHTDWPELRILDVNSGNYCQAENIKIGGIYDIEVDTSNKAKKFSCTCKYRSFQCIQVERGEK